MSRLLETTEVLVEIQKQRDHAEAAHSGSHQWITALEALLGNVEAERDGLREELAQYVRVCTPTKPGTAFLGGEPSQKKAMCLRQADGPQLFP